MRPEDTSLASGEDEEIYRITPLGLLGNKHHAQLVRKMKQIGENAVVLVGDHLEWATVEKT